METIPNKRVLLYRWNLRYANHPTSGTLRTYNRFRGHICLCGYAITLIPPKLTGQSYQAIDPAATWSPQG